MYTDFKQGGNSKQKFLKKFSHPPFLRRVHDDSFPIGSRWGREAMKAIYFLPSRANPRGHGLLAFPFFLFRVRHREGWLQGLSNCWSSPCPSYPPHSCSSRQGKQTHRAWLLELCPIVAPTYTGALLRMGPNHPARKFQGKPGHFLQLSIVSSITLTLTYCRNFTVNR